MANTKILEKFGQILINEVRDEAIEKFEKITTGVMKSKPALELNEKLRNYSKDQISTIRQAIICSIDDVLHNFLWALEQHEELDILCGEDDTSKKENIKNLSDGLSGEIYTEDGWIAKFSKYKENY